jgi:hypothetical protein
LLLVKKQGRAVFVTKEEKKIYQCKLFGVFFGRNTTIKSHLPEKGERRTYISMNYPNKISFRESSLY